MSRPVHVIVNHLHLRDPMPPEIVDKAQDAVWHVVGAGGDAAHVAKVDDRNIVLILVFDGPEAAPESHARSADRGCARTSCR